MANQTSNGEQLMCLGGGGAPTVEAPKPVPLPAQAAPPPPPREAPAPRKPVEEAGKTPDVQLGSKKKTRQNRSSITSAAGRTGAPNIGASSGTINI